MSNRKHDRRLMQRLEFELQFTQEWATELTPAQRQKLQQAEALVSDVRKAWDGGKL